MLEEWREAFKKNSLFSFTSRAFHVTSMNGTTFYASTLSICSYCRMQLWKTNAIYVSNQVLSSSLPIFSYYVISCVSLEKPRAVCFYSAFTFVHHEYVFNSVTQSHTGVIWYVIKGENKWHLHLYLSIHASVVKTARKQKSMLFYTCQNSHITIISWVSHISLFYTCTFTSRLLFSSCCYSYNKTRNFTKKFTLLGTV